MDTGISLYFGNGREFNEEVVRKAEQAGVKYAFTSLHIPEEENVDFLSEVKNLASACGRAGIQLIADIGPETLEKLGISRFDDLRDFQIGCIRPDYGLTTDEIICLSKQFMIVWNASTVTDEMISEYLDAGADLHRFFALHNFYPKPYTGLSIERVYNINEKLRNFGIRTMAFVPGDDVKRGPLMEGLPTVEEHRKKCGNVAGNMLSLYEHDTDVVIIGDPDISEGSWNKLRDISGSTIRADSRCVINTAGEEDMAQDGPVVLHASLDEGYRYLAGSIFHDRVDSSDYVIRAVESRSRKYKRDIPPGNTGRTAGDILISNKRYMRYECELEIAKKEMEQDPRVNIIGKVADEDLRYLPSVENGRGFELVIDNK